MKEGNPRGNGLGLYICQGIVTAHGGRLWADSSLDSGSIFSFTLPMHLGQDTVGESTFLKQSGTTQRLAQSISSKLERQQMEDRLARAGLLNELNHRVKNTLATVQAIASLTVNSSASLDSFRKSFDARLFALSQAHDALARAEWISTELIDLVEQLRGVDGDRSNITFKGDPVTLEPRVSLTLSMVFHELMANALQHGALSSLTGQVTVATALNTADNPPTLRIDWLETDGPPVVASTARGFGFRLIQRSIERELKGKVDIQFASTGISWSLLIPWPDKPEDCA
ncbi:Bacteriophytochrome [Pseudomonas coronafaciens pv. garcae]|nr:Bacteriophytochrome [Pseudomonas coronafaciens pv. garcae]